MANRSETPENPYAPFPPPWADDVPGTMRLAVFEHLRLRLRLKRPLIVPVPRRVDRFFQRHDLYRLFR